MYFQRALRGSRHEVHHFWTQDSAKIPTTYDLYLRIDHGDYKHDIPSHLRPSAFYAIDTHLEHPFSKIREQAKHYDFVFCAQKDGVAKLKKRANISAHWVPVGCDPEIHRRLPGAKRFDFGFVGTNGKNNPRLDYLNWIREHHPQSFVGKAAYSRMGRIYSKSRIGFNYSIANDVNMRIFEVMACGALLLSNRLRDNGLEDLFDTGRHMALYGGRGEFEEKAARYLSDAREREKIAEAGYQEALKRHTYRHRVTQMFDIMRRELLGRYARLTL